jgi:hypothetical protein
MWSGYWWKKKERGTDSKGYVTNEEIFYWTGLYDTDSGEFINNWRMDINSGAWELCWAVYVDVRDGSNSSMKEIE